MIWTFGNEIFENGLLSFVIRSLVILIIGYGITRLLTKAFKKAEDKNEMKTVSLRFAERILRFLIYCICLFSILSGIRFLNDLGTAILGATSVFSVIVGLAAQESFGNFIAGFFLAMYHPFNVGDIIYLKEQEIEGTVVQITFRQTEIKSVTGSLIVIPNSIMNSAIIENKSYSNSGYTSSVEFIIPYETDLETIKKLIKATTEEMDVIVDKRSREEKDNGEMKANAAITGLESNGYKIKVYFDVASIEKSGTTANEIRKQLLKAFKENKITPACTKIDVASK